MLEFIKGVWSKVSGSEDSPDVQLQELIEFEAARQINPDAELDWYKEGHWLYDNWEGSIVQGWVGGIASFFAEGLPNLIADWFDLDAITEIANVSSQLDTVEERTTLVSSIIDQNSASLNHTNLGLPEDVAQDFMEDLLKDASEEVRSPNSGWGRIGNSIFGAGEIEDVALQTAGNVYNKVFDSARNGIIQRYLEANGLHYDERTVEKLIDQHPEISAWARSMAEEISGVQKVGNSFERDSGGVYSSILNREDPSLSFSGDITSPPTSSLNDFVEQVRHRKQVLERLSSTVLHTDISDEAARDRIIDLAIEGEAFTLEEQQALQNLRTVNRPLYDNLIANVRDADSALHGSLGRIIDINLYDRDNDGAFDEIAFETDQAGAALSITARPSSSPAAAR